jgi:hypothetical protein
MKPLFTVLGELAMVRPGLVLQRGPQYWRIENLLRQARRDIRDPEHHTALGEPVYAWETIDGKTVIRSQWPNQGEIIEYAEVGSPLVPQVDA